MKPIFKQVKRLFSKGYPSAYIPTKFWSWNWNKEGKVEYNNLKTLINYLNSI